MPHPHPVVPAKAGTQGWGGGGTSPPFQPTSSFRAQRSTHPVNPPRPIPSIRPDAFPILVAPAKTGAHVPPRRPRPAPPCHSERSEESLVQTGSKPRHGTSWGAASQAHADQRFLAYGSE